jgi:hypothetical protein
MNIICFGQQPCGFFPKRFLVAKIKTAQKLRAEIGGRIVFFYHDSDADYRETITIMRDQSTGAEVRLNFTQENKLQKKFSPLNLKRIPAGWKDEILKQLPRFVDKPQIDLFASVNEKTVADFCLEMYRKTGLLEGIEVLRSSDKSFRQQAQDLATDYFADVEYQGEVVRAQMVDGGLRLHEGGGKYTQVPAPTKIEKLQTSAGAAERFKWMQSVIKCTHYVYGEGEKDYLKFNDFPDVRFIKRDDIEQPNYAWLG